MASSRIEHTRGPFFLRDKLYKLVPDSKSAAEAVAINGREFLMTKALQVAQTLRLYKFQSIITTTRSFSDYFRGLKKLRLFAEFSATRLSKYFAI